jgi:hypothetical protein
MSEKGTVVNFSERRLERLEEVGNEVIERSLLYAVRGLETLGYPDDHMAMFKQYAGDTRVLQMDIAPSYEFPEGCLTVYKQPRKGHARAQWHHAMVLHPDNLDQNQAILKQAFMEPSENSRREPLSFRIEPELSVRLAQQWTIFNLIGGIASEAAYVVHQQGNKFIPSFNGHSPHYKANLYLSRLYVQTNPQGINETEDALKFGYGLGLYLLGGVFRSEQLRLSAYQAEEAIQNILRVQQEQLRLRLLVPHLAARAFPYPPDQISERLSQAPNSSTSLLSRSSAKRFGSLVLLTNDNPES